MRRALWLDEVKLSAFLAAFLVGFLSTIVFLSGKDSKVLAVGGGNNECEDAEETGFNGGDEDSRTFDAPTGNVISGVCIKAGSDMFGDGHSDALENGTYESGCYTITGVGTSSVTVVRNFEAESCKGISHIDIYYDPETTPTPTDIPTPTPTEEPSPTPTDEPSPTPTEEPSPTPTEEPSPTPTEEPTPTQVPSPTPTETQEEPTPTEAEPTLTSTPSPTPTGEVAGSSSSTNDPGSSSDTQGSVLGATALADTGNQAELTMIILGIIFTGLGLYGSSAPKAWRKN